MFRRLLMTLLIACLAIPAAAAPRTGEMSAHGTQATAGSCHELPSPLHRPAVVERHDCIGCAPVPQMPRQIGGPITFRGLVATTYSAQPLSGTGMVPALPPPRA